MMAEYPPPQIIVRYQNIDLTVNFSNISQIELSRPRFRAINSEAGGWSFHHFMGGWLTKIALLTIGFLFRPAFRSNFQNVS